VARQRFEPGTILRIDVDGRSHAYARMLAHHPHVAVYDRITDADLSPEEVVALPVLFVVPVFGRAYHKGRWPKVGAVPIEQAPVEIPEYFVQDMFNPHDCQILDHSGNARPATPEECVGLERAAVWDAEHVEDRLRDRDANRPNAQVEHTKVKLV